MEGAFRVRHVANLGRLCILEGDLDGGAFITH